MKRLLLWLVGVALGVVVLLGAVMAVSYAFTTQGSCPAPEVRFGDEALEVNGYCWQVPLLGGKSFSINIPEIPMLAQGGFTNGASIAGEAGTEAVISFQRAARRDNLDIWAKAGQMLGVKPVELAEIDGGGSGGGGDMTFAPVINIQGSADRSMVEEALAEAQARFEAWYLQMQRRQARTAY